MNGASRVAKADPDGYIFLQGTAGSQAQNQTLYEKPTYNSVTDVTPRQHGDREATGAGPAERPADQGSEVVRSLRQGQ